jgi:purine-binding chemotaxis protein CheW
VEGLTWDAVRAGGTVLDGPARPRAHGRKRSRGGATEADRELLSFRLAGEDYAVDILRLREIIRVAPLTEVPRAPAFVSGVLSVRGTVVPVMDLRRRLHLRADPPTKAARILIVTKDAEPHGLLVDEVRQVERLHTDQIEPPPPVLSGAEAEFLGGIGRTDGRMLILLALDAVLSFEVPR